MKNTLMFLLVSLLLAFSLTACGGDGMQTGVGGSYGTGGQANGAAGDTGAYNGSGAYGSGAAGYNGSAASGNGSAAYGANDSDNGYVPYSSLVDDARYALDDAGNAVNRAANGF